MRTNGRYAATTADCIKHEAPGPSARGFVLCSPRAALLRIRLSCRGLLCAARLWVGVRWGWWVGVG